MFADVDPNRMKKNAAAAVKAYLDGGHDGVVAFGWWIRLGCGKTRRISCWSDATFMGF